MFVLESSPLIVFALGKGYGPVYAFSLEINSSLHSLFGPNRGLRFKITGAQRARTPIPPTSHSDGPAPSNPDTHRFPDHDRLS